MALTSEQMSRFVRQWRRISHQGAKRMLVETTQPRRIRRSWWAAPLAELIESRARPVGSTSSWLPYGNQGNQCYGTREGRGRPSSTSPRTRVRQASTTGRYGNAADRRPKSAASSAAMAAHREAGSSSVRTVLTTTWSPATGDPAVRSLRQSGAGATEIDRVPPCRRCGLAVGLQPTDGHQEVPADEPGAGTLDRIDLADKVGSGMADLSTPGPRR